MPSFSSIIFLIETTKQICYNAFSMFYHKGIDHVRIFPSLSKRLFHCYHDHDCDFIRFFGTSQAMRGRDVEDKVAFTAIDGTKVYQSELNDMVTFLSQDCSDTKVAKNSERGNALNDGSKTTNEEQDIGGNDVLLDSMFNQHAKWLKVTREIPWRRPIASLNYLLSSLVWRQDHNGFSHQDPGFIDHIVNKKAEVIRVYLPPDANTLLSVTDHCLRSRKYVNLVVAGKQPAPQWLTMDQAIKHCTAGIGIWEWASNDQGGEPDVVMACCGDVPTLENLAAVELLRKHLPELKVRVINVVDLMKLQPASEHPHGLSDQDFDSLFTKDKPIIFAFHGYPWLIHRLTYRRTNHKNLHVRGYKEEGTTTTPFDMVVLNDLDRFHLVMDVIDRCRNWARGRPTSSRHLRDKLIEHKHYICKHGDDMPEIADWRWGQRAGGAGARPRGQRLAAHTARDG